MHRALGTRQGPGQSCRIAIPKVEDIPCGWGLEVSECVAGQGAGVDGEVKTPQPELCA